MSFDEIQSKDSHEYEIFGMEISEDNVSYFLESLNDTYISLYDDEKCFNITPTRISDEYEFEIFKFDKSCATYLFYNNEIYQMGEYFGGWGATHFALEKNDSSKKLYFIYSWGSGIHRSQIGIFNFDDEELKFIEKSYMYDLQFDVNDQDTLEIYQSTYIINSFLDIKMIKGEFVEYIVNII